jgi:hypothetical protein
VHLVLQPADGCCIKDTLVTPEGQHLIELAAAFCVAGSLTHRSTAQQSTTQHDETHATTGQHKQTQHRMMVSVDVDTRARHGEPV